MRQQPQGPENSLGVPSAPAVPVVPKTTRKTRSNVIVHHPELANVIKMLFKAGSAAFWWEIVSNAWTKNPDEIATNDYGWFLLYSMATGLGAGTGMVIGAKMGAYLTEKLGLVEVVRKAASNMTYVEITEEEKKLALSKYWEYPIQQRQLFFSTLVTDGLWAISYRALDNSIKNSLGYVGWTPLFSLGFVFVGASKVVHSISKQCFKVSKRDSFNPSFKDMALIIAVAMAELGFAGGSYLSAYLKILDGGISNDVGARIVDALLTAGVAGLASIVPYLFILFKSWCSENSVRTSYDCGHKVSFSFSREGSLGLGKDEAQAQAQAQAQAPHSSYQSLGAAMGRRDSN